MPVLEGLYCPGINYTTGFPGGLFLVSIPWGSWGDYYWFLYHGVPERIITGFYTMGFPEGLFLVSISLYHGVPWGILLEDYQMNLILYFLDGVLTWYHFIFLDRVLTWYHCIFHILDGVLTWYHCIFLDGVFQDF
jgi:hypothetical protein